jgi:hypothetical protein
MSWFIDLTGSKFGRLTVIKRTRKENSKRVFWDCLCQCGKTAVARGDHLKRGEMYSCGCAQREKAGAMNRKHGLYKHPLYQRWRSMMSRCHVKSSKYYMHYGGRGIFVCDEWRYNPEKFISWSLENGWKDYLEIDRIDNNLGYYPDNVRFVTHKENMKNRRVCRYLFINGEKYTMKDASLLPGAVSYSCIRSRVKKGWTGSKAVFYKGCLRRPLKQECADIMGFVNA